jgi:hypothetical protein
MANDPNLTVMVTAFGAGSVERVPNRDAWRVTGGWLDGVEFDSAELSEAQQSEKKFIDLITRKRQQHLLKLAKEANDAPIYQRYPPQWPAAGGWALKEKPEEVIQRRLAPSLADDFTQSDGTWLGIKRSDEPMWKAGPIAPGRPFQVPFQTVRVKVPAPAPKKVEHEEPPVFRRKYRKA